MLLRVGCRSGLHSVEQKVRLVGLWLDICGVFREQFSMVILMCMSWRGEVEGFLMYSTAFFLWSSGFSYLGVNPLWGWSEAFLHFVHCIFVVTKFLILGE